MSAGRKDQFPRDGLPEIIFSGRSNVGKSSLINCLLGRTKLARVSSTPGKTITVNFYEVDGKFYFVDLPGYGFANRRPEDRAKWSALVNDYLVDNKSNNKKRLVVQLVDMKAGVTKDDSMMLDWLSSTGTEFFTVGTKSDKLNTTDRNKAFEIISGDGLVSKGISFVTFSALKGDGKADVLNEIFEYLENNYFFAKM